MVSAQPRLIKKDLDKNNFATGDKKDRDGTTPEHHLRRVPAHPLQRRHVEEASPLAREGLRLLRLGQPHRPKRICHFCIQIRTLASSSKLDRFVFSWKMNGRVLRDNI